VGELFVRHQKHRFDARVEVFVGHHHRKLAGQVGQRTDAADHHPRLALADELDRQAAKRPDLHVLDVSRGLRDQSHALFGREERGLFGVDADPDD
jgi:hypothetical protein